MEEAIVNVGREKELNVGREILAWGTLHSADFDEKILGFRVQGDMPTVARGRYAIVSAERFRSIVMQANLWRESKTERA